MSAPAQFSNGGRELASAFVCPLCASTSHDLLYGLGRHNRTVHNHICRRCGFVFVLPRPSAEELRGLYKESGFSREERGLHTPDDAKFVQCEHAARIRAAILEEHLGSWLWSKPGRCVLDVGCGTGSLLRLLRAGGWNVLGVEPDGAYVKAAEERYGITVQHVFAEDLDPRLRADLVTCFHVLEHVSNPHEFLATLWGLILEGGRLFLECPSIDSWYGDSIDHFFWHAHISTFSLPVLFGFLSKAGFGVIAHGWNGDHPWVIAEKAAPGKHRVSRGEAGRIKRIVRDAAKGKRPTRHQTPGRLSRVVSLVDRGCRLFRKDPIRFPLNVCSKGWRRVERWVGAAGSGADRGTPPPSATEIALRPAPTVRPVLRIAHLGLHGDVGNAGDVLLLPATRQLFQAHVGPIEFALLPLREKATRKTIDEINRHDALLIGGGGLFLSDSNPNSESGWTWACSLDLLEQIRVPIIVFAVGYNRFREQAEFSDVFTESVRRLVKKSVFFGVRNFGSIRQLERYLPHELHDRMCFQPCPTTVLAKYYPGLPAVSPGGRVISVNVAFDRHHLRFGRQEDSILWGLADSLRRIQNEGWDVRVFNHLREDAEVLFWFKGRGLAVGEVDLWRGPPQSIIEAYSGVALALGMRGHAQLIPFGLKRPMLSLISHDKLAFFLEDIGHPEWGVEAHDPRFGEAVGEKMRSLLGDTARVQRQLVESQDRLWRVTLDNLAMIRRGLNVR